MFCKQLSKHDKQQVMPLPPLPPEMRYLKLHVKVFCEFIKDRKTLKVSRVLLYALLRQFYIIQKD